MPSAYAKTQDLTRMPYLIRAGREAAFLTNFLGDGYVAVGWEATGDLTVYDSRDALKAALQRAYPDDSAGRIAASAGQLLRFRDLPTGDIVVTFDPDERYYYLGTLTSDYAFVADADVQRHRRTVTWVARTSRDALGTTAKNSLGSISTLFEVRAATMSDLLTSASPLAPATEVTLSALRQNTRNAQEIPPETAEPAHDQATIPETEDSLEEVREEIIGRATEFIKDQVLRLDWREMEELVAGILRGMGYKTLMTDRGSDGGRDIMASPDGLGLEPPRIIVEVKHRKGKMSAPDVRNLLGGLGVEDRGLYISTGGFTQEARYEADRARTPVTLLNLERLTTLLTQYYEKLDSDTQALVPLRKVWWPV